MEAFCRIEASSADTQRMKVHLSSHSACCLVLRAGIGRIVLTQQPFAVNIFQLLLSKLLLGSSRRGDTSRVYRHGVRPEVLETYRSTAKLAQCRFLDANHALYFFPQPCSLLLECGRSTRYLSHWNGRFRVQCAKHHALLIVLGAYISIKIVCTYRTLKTRFEKFTQSHRV